MVCTALRIRKHEDCAGYGFRRNQTLEQKFRSVFVVDELERLEFDTLTKIDGSKKRSVKESNLPNRAEDKKPKNQSCRVQF